MPNQKRRSYHHGDLRAALLTAALDDIREVGLAATSLRQVARKVGVAPSAAYKHFQSKGDLVAAIGLHGFGLLAAQMQREAAKARRDARSQLTALGRGYVRFAIAQPEHFRVMFDSQGASNEQTRPENPAYALLVGGIEALRREGRIRRSATQPELAAWAMVHGLARLMIDGVFTGSRAKIAAAIQSAADVVLVGLAAGTSVMR